MDLFDRSEEYDYRTEEIKLIKASMDKVRKKLFANHGELAKQFVQQQQEIDELRTLILTMRNT
jgi:hypothetical protein